MPRVGFEPTIPVFERPNTVRASDRSATGTGSVDSSKTKFNRHDDFMQRKSEKTKCLYVVGICSKMHKIREVVHRISWKNHDISTNACTKKEGNTVLSLCRDSNTSHAGVVSTAPCHFLGSLGSCPRFRNAVTGKKGAVHADAVSACQLVLDMQMRTGRRKTVWELHDREVLCSIQKMFIYGGCSLSYKCKTRLVLGVVG
jgi:hypothetical protein